MGVSRVKKNHFLRVKNSKSAVESYSQSAEFGNYERIGRVLGL